MIITGEALYTRMVYLGAALLLSAWLWTRLSLKGLRVSRRARSLRATVGDVFEETFELNNLSFLPRPFVEVQNQSSLPNAAGSRVLTWINRRESRVYVARSWLVRRGAFRLGPTTLVSGDPFGFFRTRRVFTETDSLLVLPIIIPLADFPTPAGILPGGKAIQRKSFDVTPHASGVREYMQGDPLKRIHWASTARRGRLMVKEFEQDPQAEVWLFLDAQKTVQAALPDEPLQVREHWVFSSRPEPHLPPSSIEYAVGLAATLAHYFIQQKKAVGFVTDSPVYTVIPAERSDRQESKILETLAFVTAEGTLPLSSLVELQSAQMPSGSGALLITPSIGDDVQMAVELLLRRNLMPVVLLLMAHSFGGDEGSEELAGKLELRGVPVCRVYNKANLALLLAEFAARHRNQENRKWL